MKVRNYEKKILINFLLIFLVLLEIIVFILCFIYKMNVYENISGIVLKDDLVVLIVNNGTKKNIYKTTLLYLNNKKIKYEIVEDRGYILKRNKEEYSEILISFKFDKNYKVNDSLQLMLKKEKIRIIEIFKIIWEGD